MSKVHAHDARYISDIRMIDNEFQDEKRILGDMPALDNNPI
jgi:hypothetical protein